MHRVAFGIVWLAVCTVGVAQDVCVSNTSRLFPDQTLSKYKGFGFNFDLLGDVLAVSESLSDLQARKGGAIHLYEYEGQEWQRRASLLPADQRPGLQFGRLLALSDNALATIARPPAVSGINQDILYLFQKAPGAPWSSLQEVYVGRIDSTLSQLASLRVINLDFTGATLAISFALGSVTKTNIYTLDEAAVLTLEATLETPPDASGAIGQTLEVLASDDLIVLGVPDFKTDDGESSGAAFAFQRQPDSSWPEAPSAVLSPGLAGQQRFGSALAMSGEALIVACDYGTENGFFEPKAFVFTPPEGAMSGTLTPTATLSTGQRGSYFSNVLLTANSDYIFYGKSIEAALSVFKKSGNSWKNGGRTALLISPTPGLNLGDQIRSNDTHLVINLPGELTGTEFTEEEIYTYEPPDGAFESLDTPSSMLIAKDSSATDDRFGEQMSMNGDWLAVGATGDDEESPASGAVYLFRAGNSGWQRHQVLRSPTGAALDRFGDALHLANGQLFVAAPGHANGQGIVYSYALEDGTWQLSGQIITPEITNPGTLVNNSFKGFGRAITSWGDFLAISQVNGSSTEDQGRVHLYQSKEAEAWQYTGSLRPGEQVRSDFFGREIVMNDSLIVVGTGARGTITDQMSVYVYARRSTGWGPTEDARLVSSDQQPADRFGYAIALHDNLIVASAINGGRPSDGVETGKAYVFRRPEGGWKGTISESLVLFPEEGDADARFGYDIYLDARYLLVSAPGRETQEGETPLGSSAPVGRVYTYDRSLSSPDGTMTEESSWAGDDPVGAFGTAILRRDRDIWVAAPGATTSIGFNSGELSAWQPFPYIGTSDEAICVGSNPIDLQVTNEPSGRWSGPGIINESEGIFDPSGLAEGLYKITFAIDDCQSSAVLTVASAPTIVSSSPPTKGICEGGTATLQATFDEYPDDIKWSYRASADESYTSLVDERRKAAIEVAAPGQYWMEYGNRGCKGSLFFEVEISEENKPVVLDRSPEIQEVCRGRPAALFVNPAKSENLTSTWFYRRDSAASFQEVPESMGLLEILAEEPGEYLVEISNGTCSEVLSYQTRLPSIKGGIVSADGNALCPGESLTLSVEVGADVTAYQWYFRPFGEASYQQIDSDGRSLQATLAGSYFSEFTTTGCVLPTDTFEVVSPQADIVLTFEPVLCYGSQGFPLSADPPGGSWSVDGTPISGNLLDPTSLDNGVYELTYAVDQLGCTIQQSGTLTVAVVAQAAVPDVFTPNADGINDTFGAGLKGDLPGYSFAVFDRSGIPIFEANDTSRLWDGAGASAGNYYWSLTYYNECQREQVRQSGSVYLLR